MKILVIDDETDSLHVFLDQIICNYHVECSFFNDDVERIMQYLENQKADAAFLDVLMPKIDGISLAKALIQKEPEIKIVFITGTSLQVEDVPQEIRKNLISIIYKPYRQESIESALCQILDEKNVLEARMFGHFDCFYHNVALPFSSTKSKELFALLLYFRGKTLSMDTAITYLWPDKDLEKAKISYRDAVWRLRQTLKRVGFDCMNYQRAALLLDPRRIHCDYYDLLDGKKKNYQKGFLLNYEWSLPLEEEIEAMKERIKQSLIS